MVSRKPVVDIGIPHKALCHHEDVVQDFGAYGLRHVSRNQAIPKGWKEKLDPCAKDNPRHTARDAGDNGGTGSSQPLSPT